MPRGSPDIVDERASAARKQLELGHRAQELGDNIKRAVDDTLRVFVEKGGNLKIIGEEIIERVRSVIGAAGADSTEQKQLQAAEDTELAEEDRSFEAEVDRLLERGKRIIVSSENLDSFLLKMGVLMRRIPREKWPEFEIEALEDPACMAIQKR